MQIGVLSVIYHWDVADTLVHEQIAGGESNEGRTVGLYMTHTCSPGEAHKSNTFVGSLTD